MLNKIRRYFNANRGRGYQTHRSCTFAYKSIIRTRFHLASQNHTKKSLAADLPSPCSILRNVVSSSYFFFSFQVSYSQGRRTAFLADWANFFLQPLRFFSTGFFFTGYGVLFGAISGNSHAGLPVKIFQRCPIVKLSQKWTVR